jgi:predicted SprT family Zn-dependent metalloprotease
MAENISPTMCESHPSSKSRTTADEVVSERQILQKRLAIVTLALRLLKLHGVGHFTFGLNQNKCRLGVTRLKQQRIELSTFHVDFSTEAEITNTILHEIAHALCPPVRNGKRWEFHGASWKAGARSIGCTGDRCGTFSAEGRDQISAVSNFVGICSHCSAKHSRQQKPMGVYRCKCLKGAFEWFQDEKPYLPEEVKKPKYIGRCGLCPQTFFRQQVPKLVYRCKCKGLLKWENNK